MARATRPFGSCLIDRKKLRIDAPFFWENHRGGWRDVVRVLSELSTPRGTLFFSSVDDQFFDHGSVSEPWVGFVHQVPYQSLRFPDLHRFVQSDAWRKSQSSCRGLWVLTEYQRQFLIQQGVTVPISLVHYPIAEPKQSFCAERFRTTKHRKLYCIGEFLRDWQAVYDLEAPGYQKVILDNPEFAATRETLRENDTVAVERRVSDEEYDRILANHIVFLKLFDAVAVTVMVECIATATPLLINRVGAVAEYLGDDYPLYFDSLNQAEAYLTDDDRIVAAHEYLQRHSMRKRIRLDDFAETLQNTTVYRALPDPYPSPQFDTVDFTVVMCTYKRLETLPAILDRFAAQKTTRRFELIVWNNSYEARDAVDAILRDYKDRIPDLQCIHSTHNYYCMIRFALIPLMRSELLMICDDDVLPEPHYLETFLSAYERLGPHVAICARGHEFEPHSLNEDEPDLVWRTGVHLQFYDETTAERNVHFMHADNLVISRELLARSLEFRPPNPAYGLVDDYWLSFVLSHHLTVPLWKIQCQDCFHFTPSANDPTLALHRRCEVNEQRVNLYLEHMRQGWPFPMASRGS